MSDSRGPAETFTPGADLRTGGNGRRARHDGGASDGAGDGAGDATAGAMDGVWAPHRRRLTTGLVLTITLVGFESLAVATIMPAVADDLGGLGLYGWVFSGFFLGSLLGIVLAGQASDRRGTRPPFAAGLGLFAAGLVVGGLAPSMPVLVAGRVAQGVGAGVIPAVAYASVGRAYPQELRPRVFAVFSTAWVLPGLLGPIAATGLAEWASWRAVFLALLPLVAIAAAMTLPALFDTAAVDGEPDAYDRRRDAGVLVVGVALVLAGLGADGPVLVATLIAVGLPLAASAFVRLVPTGTTTLKPGMPAAVAVRGILTFAFFGADAYISLALVEGRGQPTWVGGAALTGATLAWVSGAWIQERVIAARGPRWLVRRGFLALAVGVAGAWAALGGSVPVAVGVAAWTVAGLGIGLSYAPISVTVLGSAPRGQEGTASASLQLTDVLGVALGTGLSGVFIAVGEARGWETVSSLRLAFAVTLAVAVAGAAAARRLPAALPSSRMPSRPNRSAIVA